LERFAQREIVSVILNHNDSIFSHFELTSLSIDDYVFFKNLLTPFHNLLK